MSRLLLWTLTYYRPSDRADLSGPLALARNTSWLRELLEQSDRLAEVGGQHVERVAGDPLRQVDRLVVPGVEPDQDAARRVADVLDRVPVALRDVADVALLQRLDPDTGRASRTG